MRSLPGILVIFVMVGMGFGCGGTEPAGLQISQLDGDRVAGTWATPDGPVSFSSEVTAPGVFRVRFDLGGGEFGTDVDWNTYIADPRAAADWRMSARDREVMGAMAKAIEEQIGNVDPVSENLIRQANLWARHPQGALVLTQIVADRVQGWTTLCNGTSYRTFNWTWGSTAKSEYLKYGPGETSNPCRARCGSGCTAAWGTSAWTVDCGRHDRCEQYGGSGVNSQCNDELSSASDDFTFAGNCSY
jgi:hypothetical protein